MIQFAWDRSPAFARVPDGVDKAIVLFLPARKLFHLPAVFLLVLAGFFLLLAGQPAGANPRYASIVIEEASGRVLFSRSADKQLYPASLTKIMTLYMMFEALENGQLTKKTRMKVSRVAASRSPSKLYLKPGETIQAEEAILALVTKSANDVATVVAEHLAGDEASFAIQMTKKAKQLGMRRTVFKNASGLPNRAQKSTARDMARLGIAIRRDFPQYFDYFKRRSWRWRGRVYSNHNKLLSRFSGTDGIKTGYTGASGFNLVATAEQNGVRLIGVVFGGRKSSSRDQHMISLLTRQFKRAQPVQIASLPAAGPTPRPPLPVELAGAGQTGSQLPAPILPAEETSRSDLLAETPASWAIQVGSYARRINAHKAAVAARRAVPTMLEMVPADVRLVTRGSLPLWRVRFAGLEEDQARAVCARLYRMGNACFALPEPSSQTG